MKAIRDQLSLKEYFQSVWDYVHSHTRFVLRPAIAVLFIALLIMVPILERRSPQEAYAVETDIKKIAAETHVMVLKTKQKKWTVIWIVPMKNGGGVDNEE